MLAFKGFGAAWPNSHQLQLPRPCEGSKLRPPSHPHSPLSAPRGRAMLAQPRVEWSMEGRLGAERGAQAAKRGPKAQLETLPSPDTHPQTEGMSSKGSPGSQGGQAAPTGGEGQEVAWGRWTAQPQPQTPLGPLGRLRSARLPGSAVPSCPSSPLGSRRGRGLGPSPTASCPAGHQWSCPHPLSGVCTCVGMCVSM